MGASVRLRKPGNQATLHFFWLCVAFFGVFAFSFSGRLDRLDWVFYWADAISTLLLAPMFVHFALVFPERAPGWIRNRLGRTLLPIVYAPAVALGLAQAGALAGDANSAVFTTGVEVVWRFEFAYLALCIITGLTLMILTLRRVPSVTSKRQLRWIVWGAVLGGLPFAVGYAFPWALGFDTAPFVDLTAIPLCLIPLAFASAIVRYRLRDVEVIIKRGLVYTAAASAILAIYLVLQQLATAVFLEETTDGYDSIIALLATAVVVLVASPVKNAIQSMLDRVYYRDRYDYRRALVGFARDLNSDLNLDRLAERLVTRITETLVIDHTVLMLSPPGHAAGRVFRPFHAGGTRVAADWPALERSSSIGGRLVGRHTVMLDEPAAARRHPDEEVAFWRNQGIHYFVPCVSEEGTIAVLALGAKSSGEPLSSEDVALLAAVAGQVATAIENGRLYTQLQVTASEVDRVRKFNENIIESLNDGLVVLDLEDRVLRWNAALERIYGVTHAAAVGEPLTDLFDGSFIDRLHRARREQPEGATLYRVPPHVAGRRGKAAAPGQRRDHTTPDTGGRHRHDDHSRGHHSPGAAGGAVAVVGQDGVDRSAGRRCRARSQHPAHWYLEFYPDATRGHGAGRPADPTAREDRAPDVSSRQDRQRVAQSGPTGSVRCGGPSGRQRPSSTTCWRCLSISS